MQRKLRIRLVYIYLALLLILVVGVFLYDILGNTSEQLPDEENNIQNGASSGGESQDSDDSATSDNYNDNDSQNVAEPIYTIVTMEEADISAGYLVLVNYEHFFEIPEDRGLGDLLSERAGTYDVLGNNHFFNRSRIPALDTMMMAYKEETGDTTVAVISAFRGMIAQQAALDDLIERLGREEALRWAALPGHSEHHTGLAVDLGVYADGNRSTFTGDGTRAWFGENAHRFGFILRYPYTSYEVTRVAYEPWHFRYIGIPHSYIVFENELLFEQYIDYIRSYTYDAPLVFEHSGKTYEIFFTDELEIYIPIGSHYEISGNNVDGFIVTLRMPGVLSH